MATTKDVFMRIHTTFFLTIAVCKILLCQNTIDTIPFVLNESNNILIESVLNDEETLQLMFHTAVSSVSLTPEATERLSKLDNKQKSSIKSWASNEDASFSEGHHLQIGNFKQDSVTVWLNLLSGPTSDGKFGPSFFGNNSLEIDYDKSILVVHKSVTTVDSLSSYNHTSFTNLNGSLFVDADFFIDTISLSQPLLFHTGFGGTIILDDEFKQAHVELSQLKELSRKELKDSFGNSVFTKKVLIDSVGFLGERMSKLPIAYFDSDMEIQKTSIVGCEIIRRFNYVLDIVQSTLYAKPNKHFSNPFNLQ
jgi:hypothetical protein